MHDPDAVQSDDPIPYRLAHPSDLSISAFGQNDPEPLRPEAFHPTRLRLAIQDDDACGKTVQHRLIVGAIYRDLVFALLTELGPENLVHDVAVVGQEDQTGGVLVEAADRKDPFR